MNQVIFSWTINNIGTRALQMASAGLFSHSSQGSQYCVRVSECLCCLWINRSLFCIFPSQYCTDSEKYNSTVNCEASYLFLDCYIRNLLYIINYMGANCCTTHILILCEKSVKPRQVADSNQCWLHTLLKGIASLY